MGSYETVCRLAKKKVLDLRKEAYPDSIGAIAKEARMVAILGLVDSQRIKPMPRYQANRGLSLPLF
jgi:hypothetical protein